LTHYDYSHNQVEFRVETCYIHAMNVKVFDLNLLRVFAAVDSERNVSRAAAQIGLSQPAMSNALSRLRKACNDPLFVRTPGGMEPTALALEMAGPVHEALAQLDRALGGSANFDPKRVNRTFRLVMSDAGQLVVLPALMEALAHNAPGIAIEAVQIPREQYVQALENGFADLAISHLTSFPPGLLQEPLFEDSYCCVASAQHPSFHGSISVAQFAAARHIVVASGNAEAHVERTFAGLKQKRDVALSVTQYHIAIEAVRPTSLIATVPRLSVRASDNVQVMDLPFEVPKAEVRLFWHRRVHKDPANKWLREFLTKSTNQP
jgi:DNA-binding transcriptional LysR family regulator